MSRWSPRTPCAEGARIIAAGTYVPSIYDHANAGCARCAAFVAVEHGFPVLAAVPPGRAPSAPPPGRSGGGGRGRRTS